MNEADEPSSAPRDAPRHVPVLLTPVLQALAPKDGEVFLDGTFGAGGYARAILDAAQTRVIALDRDPDAVAAGRPMEAAYGGRLTLLQRRFGELEAAAAEAGSSKLDGVTLDVGVSSMQLDEAERGFSFSQDGPLDMRMEREGESAADIVNSSSEDDLKFLLSHLGEERRARAVAKAIVAARPIERTGHLAETVMRVLGRPKFGEIHPATRTFQALRIAVNRELRQLMEGLSAAERVLKPGGRLAVVTFHSLEDRIVKTFLVKRSDRAAAGSRHLPENPRWAPSFEIGSRKPVVADESEIAANPRSRSAKLRVAVRTDSPAWDMSRWELMEWDI